MGDYGDDYEDYAESSDSGSIGEIDRLSGIAFFALSTGVLFLFMKFVIRSFINVGLRKRKQHSTNLENTKIQ